MRSSFLVVAGVVLAVSGVPPARAALTEAQFPPATVRDLIAICSPAQNDPMMTAAVNYCHGYAEGAVIVEEAARESAPRAQAVLSAQPAAPKR